MPTDPAELIEQVLLRPRMFCDAQTPRELLLFILGICCGRNPPHGSDCLPGFNEHLGARLRRDPKEPWPDVLLSEYGDLPLFEACEAIAILIREWRAGEGSIAGMSDA